MLNVGERAPEIDAVASDGTRFVLSEQRGLCTVIYFFPKAFTPNCTVETRMFRDNYAELALAGASLVGVSTDDLPTQCRFAGALQAPFPLIADADRTISRAYGVLRPLLRVPRRVTYVIGPDMTVEAALQSELRVRRHRDAVLAFVNQRFLARRPPPEPSLTARLPSPARAAPASDSASVEWARAPGSAREVIAGRFEIERRVASGASGDIHRALDLTTGRAVALKLLRASPGRDDARFEREARILSDLAHPGVVAYVAHGTDATGNPYLATEWLDGESLSRRLGRDPPLTVAETIALGLRVATTLAAAHARGIIHRDLKPSNLFLPGGVIDAVKLLDFGVSRPAREMNQLTAPGDVIGTPGYMSPEQARGKGPIDARADVFSLGCVLFRCLTGRDAFGGDDLVARLLSVVTQEVPPARSLNPAVPQALSDLVARMLSKPPDARPPDGGAVAAELSRLRIPGTAS
jgi:serine/threonine-protein kinase